MAARTGERILVLNVDRDDDVGRKAGVKTPVIGYENVLKAAVKLLSADPEEADGNAMFGALRICERMRAEGRECEVAVVTGREEEDVLADMKIKDELEEVLSKFPADGVVLVTDGFADEDVIPIVSSKVPIVSVQHIVVKHSRTVEETYAVLLKYLKMLWTDKRYKAYAVGAPGAFLVIVAILSLFNLLGHALIVALFLLGSLFIVRGFSLDEKAANVFKSGPRGWLQVISMSSAALAIIAGFYDAYTEVSALPEWKEPFTNVAFLTGRFLEESLLAIVAAVFIIMLGRTLIHLLSERGEALFSDAMGMVGAVFIYFLLGETAAVLQNPLHGWGRLVLYSVIGLSVLSIMIIAFTLYKRVARRRVIALDIT